MRVNDIKHPWDEFLDARIHAMQWMRDEQCLNDIEIAYRMSIDSCQVSLIMESRAVKELIEKNKRLLLDKGNDEFENSSKHKVKD